MLYGDAPSNITGTAMLRAQVEVIAQVREKFAELKQQEDVQ
jgi:hypothetical protein